MSSIHATEADRDDAAASARGLTHNRMSVMVCVLNDRPHTVVAEFAINRARQVAVVDRIAGKAVKISRSVPHPRQVLRRDPGFS